MNIININDTSNKLFFIGGVVRDELLGRKSLDVDITYVGNAIEYCSKFGEVIQENPDFGTVRVRVTHPHLVASLPSSPLKEEEESLFSSIEIDFASTRSESYPHKGHLPVIDKIGCSLKEDVIRRDFTINALAKSVTTGEIIDYTGGLEDLKNKKLRVLHDNSFIDDPTRIIRALKFSVRFGFELEEHTLELQKQYLSNVNYDMSYKRVKKELIETFNPLIRHYVTPSPTIEKGKMKFAFEKFINEKIYKLVTEKDVELPKIDIENLINDYYKSDCSAHNDVWLIFVGVLRDLSRLPLTKIEQKILDDVPQNDLKTDFEVYKAFDGKALETILLYAILKDEKIARHYLDDLKDIKISITGKDLQNLGIPPSAKYQEIFDKVLKAKLGNPNMTIKEEIMLVKKLNL